MTLEKGVVQEASGLSGTWEFSSVGVTIPIRSPQELPLVLVVCRYPLTTENGE